MAIQSPLGSMCNDTSSDSRLFLRKRKTQAMVNFAMLYCPTKMIYRWQSIYLKKETLWCVMFIICLHNKTFVFIVVWWGGGWGGVEQQSDHPAVKIKPFNSLHRLPFRAEWWQLYNKGQKTSPCAKYSLCCVRLAVDFTKLFLTHD